MLETLLLLLLMMILGQLLLSWLVDRHVGYLKLIQQLLTSLGNMIPATTKSSQSAPSQ
jgi:hypothetical protein